MSNIKKYNNNSFDSFFDSLDRTFDKLFSNHEGLFGSKIRLATNHKNNSDGTTSVTVDVPGIKETDLSVEIDDNQIIVKGETETTTGFRSISHSFTVPYGYDPDTSEAHLNNGVLTFTFKPLPELNVEKQVKKIPIKTSSTDAK